MQSRYRFFPPPVYDAIVLLIAAYLSHHKLIACWIDPSCMAAGAIADYSLWGMIVIAVLLFLARESKLGRYWEAWRRNKLLFLFVLYAMVSVTWSVLPERSIHAVFVMVASAVTASAFAILRPPKTIFGYANIFTLLAGILSLLTILLAPGTGIHQDPVWQGAWRGIFSHKNDLGPLMALGNNLALLWFIGAKEKRGKFAAVLCYFFTLMMAVMSRSATAVILWFVLTGMTAFYFAWIKWGHLLRRVSRTTITGILSGILGAAILSVAALFQLTGKNIQLTGRIPLWKNLIDQVVSERPWFGYGMDTLWFSREFQRWASETSGWGDVAYVLSGHNGYVDILLHLGAVGLILLIVLLVQAVVRATARAISGRTWLNVFPLLALVYVLTANITVSYMLEQENFHWMLLIAIQFLPEGEFPASGHTEALNG